MKSEHNVPQVRFKGFTDAWEQREVKELCSISTGKSNTQDKTDDGEYPFYVRSPIIERSTKYLYDEEAVITVGDGVGTGKVFHYVNGKYDLHQRCYRMYGFTEELNARYFYHTFSHLFYKRVMAMTAKTSVDSVRLEMISDMEIPTPSIEEQKQIGQYFTNLDNLITLHQRKCDTLQKLKKSMLQKMFPKNGSLYPEIRFKGFTDAWEQREFGEVFVEYSEKNHEELPPLTIIQGKGTILREESDRILIYDKSGLKNYKLVNEGDFILHLRSFEGGLEVANSRGIVSPAYHIFHGENVDSRFYYPFFRSKYFISVLLKPHVYGIRDGKSIDVEGMKSINIPCPTMEEQRAIGDYFTQLDKVITLHQRKLETLKKLKKSMLQKMFI